MSGTIRINRETHEILAKLAREKNQSLVDTLDEAVRNLQKKTFWSEFSESVIKIRQDPEAWDELQKEQQSWGI